MAKVDVIQTSFAGGEFGPPLYGRTDIAQYQNACEIVENFLVRSYGPAISTPGTSYIYTASNSTLRTRLIKFVFNRTDAYAIEMGKYYFRFYTNGGIVITTGTTPFTLTHIYQDTEVFDVQYTQLNDVMYFAHPSYPPQQMTRTSSTNWTIANFNFIGGPFLDDNTTSTTITPSATAGTINLTASANLFTVSGSTLGHHNSYWKIGGLSLTNATTGLQEEGYVQITYVTNATTATATVIKLLKAATATTRWAEGAWSAVRGYPKCVTFHERRLWFARTDYEPQKVWGSRVFIYNDFALDTEADDDGLNLSLASNESNEIQWLVSGKSLIAGTFGGAFVINSKSTSPITPDNANAAEEIGFGASSVVPKKIGNYLYYVQRFGKKLREMFYNFDTDTYKAVDRTILSPHILDTGVVDMDASLNPETILYCVTTEGTLATMTREADQDLTAWSRQVTDGTYTSVAIIPSQSNLYDEVWVCVQRWINGTEKRYIELFDNIEVPDRQDLCNYLHSSLNYSAYDTSSSSSATLSLVGGTGHLPTTVGNVVISGSQSVYGGGSALFDGTGDYITFPDSSDWQLGGGSGDFTIELWIRFTDTTDWQTFVSQASGTDEWHFAKDNTGNLRFICYNAGVLQVVISSAGSFSNNTWYHVAVVRNGTTFALYKDGTQLTTTVASATIPNSTGKLFVGSQNDGTDASTGDDVNGYMDEVRISTTARYTSNFTTSTTAFSNDSYTSLLLHLDSDTQFSDSSETTDPGTATTSINYFVAADVGQRIRAINEYGTTVGEGTITAYLTASTCTLSITTVFQSASYVAGRWGLSVNQIAGLDHLIGEQVNTLNDGEPGSLKTVASNTAGTITLDSDFFVVTAGLPYEQIIYTLPKEIGSQRGTSQSKIQRISEIGFKVNRSYKHFEAGGDDEHTDVISATESTITLFTGTIPNVSFFDDYQYGSRVYIKNPDPLPIELLSIITTLDTFDK